MSQLLTGVTLAPDASIFYHLHRPFFHDSYRLAEYPNDFASWADRSLGDAVLAERLANLNLVRTPDLATVRREISVLLAEHLQQTGETKVVRIEPEFIFCEPLMVEFGTGRVAHGLREFVDCLRELPSDTIGYHLFAPFLAPDTLGFAQWFRDQGHERLAQHFETFDPYLNCLEDNRHYLVDLIDDVLRTP